MIETAHWSRNHWLATLAVGLTVWLIFVVVSPGADYARCYTWMVTEPWRLPQVAERPWTLNPPWLAPFMAPFVSLPGRAGLIVFMAATIAMTIYGVYILGGKPIPILISAHMMWILWWGQIEGFGILALVLGWFALQRKSWPLSFLALALASFKPQISLVPVLALWWWGKEIRWKALAAYAALFGLSLLIWGPWPVWYLQGMLAFMGDEHAGPWTASFGLVALPLFLPALLVPLGREKRLIALTATAYLASPYLPYYSTIAIMAFAIPWWGYLFGVLAYLPSVIGTRLAWNAVAFLPLFILVWIYFPPARSLIQKWRSKSLTSPLLD